MHPRPSSIARVSLSALAVLGLIASFAIIAAAESPPADAAAAANVEDADSQKDVPVKEWDAEQMTKLTADLSKAMRGVRDAFRNNPVLRSPDSTMQRSAARMSDTLRNLDRQCSSLASEVKKGKTADETRGSARRIGMLLRDANQIGRNLTTDAWTDEKIRPAMELINEIAPYYGRGPLYDVESMTLIDGGPNPNRRREGE